MGQLLGLVGRRIVNDDHFEVRRQVGYGIEDQLNLLTETIFRVVNGQNDAEGRIHRATFAARSGWRTGGQSELDASRMALPRFQHSFVASHRLGSVHDSTTLARAPVVPFAAPTALAAATPIVSALRGVVAGHRRGLEWGCERVKRLEVVS